MIPIHSREMSLEAVPPIQVQILLCPMRGMESWTILRMIPQVRGQMTPPMRTIRPMNLQMILRTTLRMMPQMRQ